MRDRSIAYSSLLDRLLEQAPLAAGGGSAPGYSRSLATIVRRDLGDLFNSGCLESYTDLTGYDEVRRSVLNYGLPTLSGCAASAVDVVAVAAAIRRAITAFEPRFDAVRVSPAPVDPTATDPVVGFRIQGTLRTGGEPLPLALETQFALDTGDVRVDHVSGS